MKFNSIDEAVQKACDESSTLIEAQTWICVWECERIIDHIRNSSTSEYDSFFNYLLTQVSHEFMIKKLKGV